MSTAFIGDVAITGGNTKAIVSFASSKKADANVTTVILHTEHEHGKIAAWGANNDYPQKLLKKVKPAGSLRSGLRVNRKAHYGSGFVLAEVMTDDNGKRVVIAKSLYEYPEINAFFKRNKMKRFHKEIIADLEFWELAIPEYILSKDFKKINRVKRQYTSDSRFEIMDENTRTINNLYVSSKWAEGVDVASKYVNKIPLIDSDLSAQEVKEYCKRNKIYNFIRPVFFPLLTSSYYPSPEWQSIESSGWLDIINSIPKFKKAFLEEKMNVNLHIEVFEEYFERKYRNQWEGFTPEKQKEIRTEFIEELDASLRGVENGGKSIMSIIYKDDNGTPQPGLKITEIEKGKKDGAYLDDTAAGVQASLTAAGVTPSLIGAGIPGGKLGAGSGTDKIADWNILSCLKKHDRDTTLEIFEFIQEYNGWPDNLVGGFEDTVLTSLDKNPTGTQKAAQL
ncbi:conserved hypothetical protein [Tenacibaculum maritimum]|uniref:hypothetical protein n=1 Tax=Tenacibaculum maritimum TaxID=107401 RepID=UPI0012E62057|nr:hypothetical protein [Tenacibaculum maritimum]CAA0149920.1 conserved hypothetical protein [Tenacibaculum maritimum]